MKKNIVGLTVLLLTASLASCGSSPTVPAQTESLSETPAQSPDAEPEAAAPIPCEVPKAGTHNPLTGFDADGNIIYGGDPSALVVDDTLYLYVGHDTAKNESYVIPEYLCYSTKDMANWKYEGVVLKMSDVSWADKNSAWAGQVARHYDKTAGKDRYYLYYCSWDSTDNGKQSIGAAVSDSPTGPFTDIGAPLVKGSVTADETSAWNDIDPTVWIEDGEDGEEHRYLMWGNSKLYVCELNEDMLSVKDYDGDGEIKFRTDIRAKAAPDSYTEAPWIYRRKDENGKYYGDYYLFYAYGWREQMAYATTKDLMTGKLYFQDTIMKPTATSNTNHMAVVDFLGRTWFIYHNGSLPGGSGFRRVACAEELEFYPDGAVHYVDETASGITRDGANWQGWHVLMNIKGDTLEHEWFNNSLGDNEYPYTGMGLGSGLAKTNTEDQKWVMVPGKASPDDPYTVSIESENKPGLYITIADGKPVLCQDYDGKHSEAQTFRTYKGLAGKGFSFEPFGEHGKYLTLSDGTLTLTDGSDANASSFYIAGMTALVQSD